MRLLRLHSVLSVCSVVQLLFFCANGLAQTRWTLTTADFQSKQVDLVSIDQTGATVTDKAGERSRVVPWDQLLLLDREIESKPPTTAGAGKFVLTLTSGDLVRGELVTLSGETLRWKSSAVGEISFPL